MKRINTADLVPGMVTAEDVFNFSNQLVLPKGLILNDSTITKLSSYSILQVGVEDVAVEIINPQDIEPSYSEKLKSSPDFIQFKEEFESDINSFKSAVNDVVEKGAPLNVDALMNHTLSMLEPDWTCPNIFDMLHCMREYDDVTYVHSMNVALICNVFARWLRFGEEEIREATVSGLLHDIGKTKIADSIVKKPGKLTEQEYDIMKSHPIKGYEMLKSSTLSANILNAVLMHHERCDGSGYPYGCTGRRIGTYARMVAIADAYDAMTSSRVYRGPLCPFKAIALFEEEGLQKYDTKFILTFLENVVNAYLLDTVRLNNGVTGKIVYINKNRLSAPTIQTRHGFLDLSIHPELHIEDII